MHGVNCWRLCVKTDRENEETCRLKDQCLFPEVVDIKKEKKEKNKKAKNIFFQLDFDTINCDFPWTLALNDCGYSPKAQSRRSLARPAEYSLFRGWGSVVVDVTGINLTTGLVPLGEWDKKRRENKGRAGFVRSLDPISHFLCNHRIAFLMSL